MDTTTQEKQKLADIWKARFPHDKYDIKDRREMLDQIDKHDNTAGMLGILSSDTRCSVAIQVPLAKRNSYGHTSENNAKGCENSNTTDSRLYHQSLLYHLETVACREETKTQPRNPSGARRLQPPLVMTLVERDLQVPFS